MIWKVCYPDCIFSNGHIFHLDLIDMNMVCTEDKSSLDLVLFCLVSSNGEVGEVSF